MLKIIGRATLVACLATGPALAENLLASDPDAVMLAMQKEGFLVTLGEADDRTPKLSSKVSDTTFNVYFYGCEGEDVCTSVQFSAGYDLDNATSAGKAAGTTTKKVTKTNQWNSENRYARAVVDDEGDPFLRMDMVMVGDGVGAQTFAEALELWRILVEDFEEFIDW